LRKNLYKSYEDGDKNVWLTLSTRETLELLGNSYYGYSIIKRGRVGVNHPNKKEGWQSISMFCGDAGVYFTKRKDAENYALALAMCFNGDLPNKDILDPSFFNGRFKKNFNKNSKINELFNKDITRVDPTEGWDFFDFSTIKHIPDDFNESYPVDEDTFEPLDDRYNDLEYFLDKFSENLEENILNGEGQKPLNEIIENFISENKECDFDHGLRGYAILCLISYYKKIIPFSWIFPNQESYISSLIPKLIANLPEYVSRHLKIMEEQGSNFIKV